MAGRPVVAISHRFPFQSPLLPLFSLFWFAVFVSYGSAFVVPASLALRGRPSCNVKNGAVRGAQNSIGRVSAPHRRTRAMQRRTPITLQAGSSDAQLPLDQLTADAPDAEGNTVGHWCEVKGTVRWALVEPNLAALKKEMQEISDACEKLEQKICTICSSALEGQNEEVAVVEELETLQQRMTGSVEATFERADTSGTQELSFAEWRAAFGLSRPLFDSLDADGDGALSLPELEAAERMSKQLVALKTKREALALGIAQYEPSENAPECIAEGGQGMVLAGKDLASGERVAIKVERVRGEAESESALRRECEVLRALHAEEGFPAVRHMGRQALNSNPQPTDCRVMVMDLLGASVADVWWDATRGASGFEPATALRLAVSMLDLLEKLHHKRFVHRDIKPANFVLSGQGGQVGQKRTAKERGSGRLCLIDFGIALPVEAHPAPAAPGASSSSLWGKQFFGTVPYASVSAHRGDAQSYRDDLEALVYVFAWMLNGGLPWGGCSDPDEVMAMKISAVDSLIAGECRTPQSKAGKPLADADRMLACPCTAAMRELFAYCRTLSPEQRPDYARSRATLMGAYAAVTGREKLAEDEEWEWNRPQRAPAKKPLDFMDLM